MTGVELLLVLLAPLLLALAVLFGFPDYKGYWKEGFPNLPPGEFRGFPFIGETFSFMKPHPTSELGTYIKSNMQKYGRIFRMNLLGKPTIISADPDFNRFVLNNEGKMFLWYIPKSMVDILGKQLSTDLTGDIRRMLRSNAVSFLNDAGTKLLFLRELDRRVVDLMESWKTRSTLSMKEEAKKFVFDLMAKYLLNMETGTVETDTLRREYSFLLKGMASLPLNLPGTSYYRALQSRSVILGIIEKKLDQHIQMAKSIEKGKGDNLLNVVSMEKNLSKQGAMEFLLGAIFASYETVSTAMILTIYFLDTCPKAIEELRDEHLAIFNSKEGVNEELSWIDYKDMVFTECVVNEVLRIGNIIKFVYRKTIMDVQYKGFVIPSGWKVVPILSAPHLDPAIYEDPQVFNPWRWKSDSKTKDKKNLMAFGGGPRQCPGEDVARMQLTVFIHHLVLNYDWELAEPDYPICLSFVDFPKGLPIKLRPLHLLK